MRKIWLPARFYSDKASFMKDIDFFQENLTVSKCSQFFEVVSFCKMPIKSSPKNMMNCYWFLIVVSLIFTIIQRSNFTFFACYFLEWKFIWKNPDNFSFVFNGAFIMTIKKVKSNFCYDYTVYSWLYSLLSGNLTVISKIMLKGLLSVFCTL